MTKPGGKVKRKKSGNNNDDNKSNSDDDCCSTCNKTEKETEPGVKWVTCFICGNWNHVMCLTKSEELQKILDEDHNVFIRCKKCSQADLSTNSLQSDLDVPRVGKNELKGLREMVTALANENCGLQTGVSQLSAKIDLVLSILDKVNNDSKKGTQILSSQLDDFKTEILAAPVVLPASVGNSYSECCLINLKSLPPLLF